MSENEKFPGPGSDVEGAVERDEQAAAAQADTESPTTLSPEEFEHEALSHIDALYSGALRLTRHQHDAEDLVQDTYVRAFRASTSFKAGTNMRAWLFRIMHNAFISSYRKRSAAPRNPEASRLKIGSLPAQPLTTARGFAALKPKHSRSFPKAIFKTR